MFDQYTSVRISRNKATIANTRKATGNRKNHTAILLTPAEKARKTGIDITTRQSTEMTAILFVRAFVSMIADIIVKTTLDIKRSELTVLAGGPGRPSSITSPSVEEFAALPVGIKIKINPAKKVVVEIALLADLRWTFEVDLALNLMCIESSSVLTIFIFLIVTYFVEALQF
jgi:hypothetical protein